MKKLIVMTLCCAMLAGCGGAGTSSAPSADSAGTSSAAAAGSSTTSAVSSSSASAAASAAASSAGAEAAASAASGTEASAANTSANSSAAPISAAEAEKATKDFEEYEFKGIKFLVHPDWAVEVKDGVCRFNTDNENVSFVLGHISGDSFVSDDTVNGIYSSLQAFLGETDSDVELLKFGNGIPYILYYSDFDTDHAYNSVFYAKEGLFAFGLQLIGDVDKKEEERYEKQFRGMLASMDFEEAEYQSMSGDK